MAPIPKNQSPPRAGIPRRRSHPGRSRFSGPPKSASSTHEARDQRDESPEPTREKAASAPSGERNRDFQHGQGDGHTTSRCPEAEQVPESSPQTTERSRRFCRGSRERHARRTW
jgi:hypothetical protein